MSSRRRFVSELTAASLAVTVGPSLAGCSTTVEEEPEVFIGDGLPTGLDKIDGPLAENLTAMDLPESARFLGMSEMTHPELLVRALNSEIDFHSLDNRGGNAWHNARMYTDLARLLPMPTNDESSVDFYNSRVLSASGPADVIVRHPGADDDPGFYYVRSEAPELLDGELDHPNPWTLNLWQSRNPNADDRTQLSQVNIGQILELAEPVGATMMECAGNDKYSKYGLMSSTRWKGIRIEDVLGRHSEAFGLFDRDTDLTHALVDGFDDSPNTDWNRFPGLVESRPTASWIFSLTELVEAGAFLATHMYDPTRIDDPWIRLPRDHGFPLRLVMPGWYGCASMKWLGDAGRGAHGITFFSADETTEATSQMREFSDRTFQTGEPRLYVDHTAPAIDLAAVPVRVERWALGEEKFVRIVGVMWGGQAATPNLRVRLGVDEAPVDYNPRTNVSAFTAWTKIMPLERAFRENITLTADLDVGTGLPLANTRRLDSKYYQRCIHIKRSDLR